MSTIAELLALAPGAVGTLTSPAVILKIGKTGTAKNNQPWALFTVADHTGESGFMWMPCGAEIGFAAGKTVISAPNAIKIEEYQGVKKLRAEGASALVISVAPPAAAPAAAGAYSQQPQLPSPHRQQLAEAEVLAFIARAAGPIATSLFAGTTEALAPPAARRSEAALAAALDGGARYAPTPDALVEATKAILNTIIIGAEDGKIALSAVKGTSAQGALDADDIPF